MDLVYEIKGSLDPEFCRKLIQKFDVDERRQPGRTRHGIVPQVKDSSDLMIGRFQDWSSECEILDKKLDEGIEKFINFAKFNNIQDFGRQDLTHNNHYQMQKSGKFEWHHDFMIQNELMRVLTFMWYLNVPDEGGETDFVYKKVKPETGKLVIFPATWDKVHRGCPAKNKYIITGWLWRNI
jgi:2OG-Fe(II) oxygenase superfamily